MNPTAQHQLQLRLLFDADLRARLRADPDAALAGLDPADAAVFRGMDLDGLELDAQGRARYLMSALGRAWPVSMAALGAALGPAALSAFLATPALFLPMGPRTLAFGAHLQGLLDRLPEPGLVDLLGPTLSLEQGLAQNAANLREAVARGARIPPPQAWSKGDLKRKQICFAPFSGVAVLPQPSEVLAAALDHPSAEDPWTPVALGRASVARLISVARAEPSPVTVVFRGVAGATTLERAGAGGLMPVTEVRHLRAELRGRKDAWLSSLDGSFGLADLPPAQERLARSLLEAGLLTLAG